MENENDQMAKVDVTDFAEDLAAGIGIIPVKQLKIVKTDVEGDLAGLDDHGGPIPFICRNSDGAFFQSGIERQTNSWAGHAGLFVGKRNAQIIRAKCPYLLQSRRVSGLFTDHDWVLPPVPAEARDYEVIESQITININDMREVVREGMQAVSFVRDWTDSQTGDILEAAYKMFGAPYDILEIAHDVFPWVPNPTQLKVCSSFTLSALAKGDPDLLDWMKAHNVDPEAASPADLGRYLFSNAAYQPVAFRCDLAEARGTV